MIENLGKIKKVYKMYVADSIVHIEEFPVVYVNKKYLYYIDHGSGDLVKLYNKSISSTDIEAFERIITYDNIRFVPFSNKIYSYNNSWFLNRTVSKDYINKEFSENDISRAYISKIKTDLMDKVNKKKMELDQAGKNYKDFCDKFPDEV